MSYSLMPELGYHVPFDDLLPPAELPEARDMRRDRPMGEIVGISGLSKTFARPEGNVRALDGITFSFRRGEICGVIGRSGAGKTTLIRCIGLLEQPSAGEVIFDGEAVQDLADERLIALRRKIGVVFQQFNLLPSRTVSENVALPLKFAGRRPWEILTRTPYLLQVVDLASQGDSYPVRLSADQKQRVAIARALALHPEILLCDDPTSALDPASAEYILRILKDLNRRLGITILLVTRDMAVARDVCDRLVVLDAGQIVEEGSTWEVFAKPQSDVTKRLLQATLPALPASLREKLETEPSPSSDAILRLQFGGSSALDPVVAEFARTTGADFSVIHGSIEYIQEQPLGILFLALSASRPEQLSGHVAYLRAKAVDVEVLGYVPRPV
jgi:D-methionine transport system ATP-binding protein